MNAGASPAPWRVRPAREEDLDRLIEVARRSWLSAFAQTAPFPLIEWWVRTDRTAALYREHWEEMHVLEDHGVIIGLMQPIGNEINGLWVHPDWHGRGVGTTLLTEAEAIILGARYAVAWLSCSGLNGRALEFYRKRGYAETGRERERHACGVELESIRMERRLS